MSKNKCKYYRESPIEQWTPSCTGPNDAVHSYDVEKGDYCQMCGGKVKFKDYTRMPLEVWRKGD